MDTNVRQRLPQQRLCEGRHDHRKSPVSQVATVTYKPKGRWRRGEKDVPLAVIGRNRGYKEETRESNIVKARVYT